MMDDQRAETNIDSLCGFCWAAVPAAPEKNEDGTGGLVGEKAAGEKRN